MKIDMSKAEGDLALVRPKTGSLVRELTGPETHAFERLCALGLAYREGGDSIGSARVAVQGDFLQTQSQDHSI